MKEDIRLKACPFCGFPRPKIVMLPRDDISRFTDKYMAICDYREGGCGAASGWCCCPEEAAEIWNQRRRKWHGRT